MSSSFLIVFIKVILAKLTNVLKFSGGIDFQKK